MRYIVDQIAEFIENRPGYLKEGSKRIAKRFNCSREEAKEGIREARKNIKKESREHTNTPLNLRSAWQAPDGSWLYSYRAGEKGIDEDKIKEIVEDSLKDIESQYIPVSSSKSNERGLFVWTSDKHVGSTVDSSIYENNYDEEEFQRRMFKVVEKCLDLKKTFGKFHTLFLADLGDPLDGKDNTTVRGGHDLPQNMSDEEQAKVYIRTQKAIIDSLIKNDVANNYIIWNVCNDNHSGSFGYVANLAIKEYVSLAYPQVTFHNQEKFIEHTSYGIHDIILSHGKDTEDRKKGLPLNLDDRTEKFISEYIDYHNLKGEEKHFIKGDLHRSSENITNKFRYKNCPSIFGASKWIHNNFGLGRPACDIEIFNKEDPEVIKMSVDLG